MMLPVSWLRPRNLKVMLNTRDSPHHEAIATAEVEEPCSGASPLTGLVGSHNCGLPFPGALACREWEFTFPFGFLWTLSSGWFTCGEHLQWGTAVEEVVT